MADPVAPAPAPSPVAPDPVAAITKAKADALAAIQQAASAAGEQFRAGLGDAAETLADDARDKLTDGFQSMAAAQFDEFKDWIRRELELAMQGIGPAQRTEMNP